MAKVVNPLKKRKLKHIVKAGETRITKALQMAGYSESTAKRGYANKSAKLIDEEITREFDKSKLTVEWVLDNLEQLRIKAETKKDYGTAKGILELIGKWKRMWDEKSITQVNVYSQTPEDKKSLADIKNRIHKDSKALVDNG